MGTNYPGGLDNFAGTSPTYMADDDTTGRTHPERHDDVELAMEAVQTELGTNPSGAATDVAARFTALDTTVGGKAPIASPTFTGTLTAPIIASSGRFRLAVNGSNPGSPETGDLYYNDASHHIRYYDGSGWDTLVDVEDAQTISGVKTFSANPVFNDAGIPQAKVANLVTDLAGKGSTVALWLPGTSGNYVSCPDASRLHVTGDLDVRVRVALDDWTPAATARILARRSTNYCYELFLFSDGTIALGWTTDGTTQIYRQSSVATGVTDGSVKWIRATLDVDNGASGHDVKFYLSDDGVTWTQLGVTRTSPGTTSVYAGTAPLEVGSISGGTGGNAIGRFYRAQVLNGINGTLVADLDLTHGAGPRIRDAQTNLWTINGTANGWMVA